MAIKRGVNKVILMGNLGADPETRYSPSGQAVTNLRLATTEAWRDKGGQLQERTEWHRVVLFGGVAETASKYLRKGSSVYIEGRLQTRKWQGQDGQEKYTTEVIGAEMRMLDGPSGGGAIGAGGGEYGGGNGGQRGGGARGPARGDDEFAGYGGGDFEGGGFGDDVPF